MVREGLCPADPVPPSARVCGIPGDQAHAPPQALCAAPTPAPPHTAPKGPPPPRLGCPLTFAAVSLFLRPWAWAGLRGRTLGGTAGSVRAMPAVPPTPGGPSPRLSRTGREGQWACPNASDRRPWVCGQARGGGCAARTHRECLTAGCSVREDVNFPTACICRCGPEEIPADGEPHLLQAGVGRVGCHPASGLTRCCSSAPTPTNSSITHQ